MYLVPQDCFLLPNSADPNEMSPYAAFHLGRHCFICQSAVTGIQNEKSKLAQKVRVIFSYKSFPSLDNNRTTDCLKTYCDNIYC